MELIEGSLPEVVMRIRNPEARSSYSNILASAMTDYLTETFSQVDPPSEVLGLRARQGLILFEGSVLRGTVTEKTADFDLGIMFDDGLQSESLSLYFGLINRLHPQNKEFNTYLRERLLADPSTKPYYDDRVAELQRRKDYNDAKYGRKSSPIELGPGSNDASDFIHIDEAILPLQDYVRAIKEVNPENLQPEQPTRLIVSILTAPPNMVFEVTPGALAYHQRKLTEALAYLQKTNPIGFRSFYNLLEKDFANAHKSTAWRYPGRDFRLLAEYYLRSGKFSPAHLQPQQLIELVSKKLMIEVVKEGFEYWRRHNDYKDNEEGLLRLMEMKFGSEEGLNKEVLKEIASGKNFLQKEEESMSPQALKEVDSFKRRIKSLMSIRNRIKLPSLEEFQEAYL